MFVLHILHYLYCFFAPLILFTQQLTCTQTYVVYFHGAMVFLNIVYTQWLTFHLILYITVLSWSKFLVFIMFITERTVNRSKILSFCTRICLWKRFWFWFCGDITLFYLLLFVYYHVSLNAMVSLYQWVHWLPFWNTTMMGCVLTPKRSGSNKQLRLLEVMENVLLWVN